MTALTERDTQYSACIKINNVAVDGPDAWAVQSRQHHELNRYQELDGPYARITSSRDRLDSFRCTVLCRRHTGRENTGKSDLPAVQ
ncbi:hypothetical protein [Mesorhizobium sanjuanii]|uniref:hypothetical protein n=1 Tax=Mesorhizobium sanjuanii TaxID=2037900 RepID=UPI001AD80A0B|nr:hypothetical protein [Mesorhizobium sanjuanii]